MAQMGKTDPEKRTSPELLGELEAEPGLELNPAPLIPSLVPSDTTRTPPPNPT